MEYMSERSILVVNPGSASRKYALYHDNTLQITAHFELEGDKVVYSVNNAKPQKSELNHIAFSASKVPEIIGLDKDTTRAPDVNIALRVVAPSRYFQQHRLLNQTALAKLTELEQFAPLHISETLQELLLLKRFVPHHKLIGVSDSAYHATMPDKARHYGISLKDAEYLQIYRYGYHGLSVQSVVRQLTNNYSLPERLLVCHLGSGASITAILNGRSVDTTMGYSPLEGLVMSTRSGSIDPTAIQALKVGLNLTPVRLQEYLNNQSGLLGVSGISNDIRVLLNLEKTGHKLAKLALSMYIYRIQQAIGQMSASLGGIDAIIFTGTVGERSSIIRNRVCRQLHFLGIELDNSKNNKPKFIENISTISVTGSPVNAYIIPTNEMSEMFQSAKTLL